MTKKALIVWGGWDGHQPKAVADVFDRVLTEAGFGVELSDTLVSFEDAEMLRTLSLIVPVWTMGEISDLQVKTVLSAIEQAGVGVAGCHGGLCDAFRTSPEWNFMTGGQFVSHPGNDGLKHRIEVVETGHEITAGIEDFDIATEQYYMHVDPAVGVLATTRFPVAPGPHTPNGEVNMPVVWTKRYGAGRVFYNSLGHSAAVVESEPCLTLMRRGFSWAARS